MTESLMDIGHQKVLVLNPTHAIQFDLGGHVFQRGSAIAPAEGFLVGLDAQSRGGKEEIALDDLFQGINESHRASRSSSPKELSQLTANDVDMGIWLVESNVSGNFGFTVAQETALGCDCK